MRRTIGERTVYVCVAIMLASLCGCSSYAVPGRGADVGLLAAPAGDPGGAPSGGPEAPGTDVAIVRREPTASFPARVAVVRIQEPGYETMTTTGVGGGQYSVVTLRDIERDEDFERLARLPYLAQISPVNKLLLPTEYESDQELRQAAARLQADMLLVYTVDTTFLDRSKSTLLSVVSLGLGPTIDLRVITTVSALVMDVRTGYLYGTIEETARVQKTTAALSTREACDQVRLTTERQAFEGFLAEFETLWPTLVENYKD